MSTRARETSLRKKVVRVVILSVSLLGFLPVFGLIRTQDAALAATASTAPAVSSSLASSITQNYGVQTQTSSSTQKSVTTRTHARTRGS